MMMWILDFPPKYSPYEACTDIIPCLRQAYRRHAKKKKHKKQLVPHHGPCNKEKKCLCKKKKKKINGNIYHTSKFWKTNYFSSPPHHYSYGLSILGHI